MSRKPRVNVAHEIESFTDRRACDPYGHTTPGVTIRVGFDLHDHVAALAALEQAASEVRAQIAEATA